MHAGRGQGFRELGDQAGDLPQEMLAALGGAPHPLRRKITAPSEKRLRTLLQALDAAMLDEITGGWLRALAAAGRLEGLLTAIAIDGKWLRGVADGQVKLFAAMLHEEKVIIAQHRIPDDTNEITQVRELLDPVDLTGAVVTADAVHTQHDTAEYIGGERESDYLLTVKGNQPGLQRAIYDKISADCGTAPDHASMDYSHGRIIRRSIWVTGAGGIEFPHAAQVLRIRRDTYDTGGTAITKEIVHGITSLDAARGTPGILAGLTRGQWGIESVHWVRDTACREDASTGYAGNGPQVMATLRNIAVSLLYLAGITEITRTLQSISRDRNRVLGILPLQGFNEGAGSVQPSCRLDGVNSGPAVRGSCRFPHLTGSAARAAPPGESGVFFAGSAWTRPWRSSRLVADEVSVGEALECRWLGQAGDPGRWPLPVRPEMARVSFALMDLS